MKSILRKSMWTVMFLLFLVLLSCVQKAKPGDESGVRPNIVLIFSDELQFRDLGFSGGDIPTPNLDALAGEGMYFENTYTPAPMCTPSRYSLLSGRFPGRCSDTAFLEQYPVDVPYCIGWNTHLEESVQTIPRLLSAGGYLTGMVGKWHLSRNDFRGDLLRLEDDPSDPAVNDRLRKYQSLAVEKVCRDGGFDVAESVLFGNFDAFPVEALRCHNFPWFTRGALDFLEKAAQEDRPFFLYLTPTSLHGPHHAKDLRRDYSYTPEGKIEGLNELAPGLDLLEEELDGLGSPESHRYSGMRFLDHMVGLVMDKLDELGISENTVVIFLPDHNTEPGKSTCYEKGVKIPMIIRWPGKIRGGSRTPARVQTMDLMPTILEMADISLPDGYEIDGISMVPAIENPEVDMRKYIFSESGYTRSVSVGAYKYIAFRYPDRHLEAMKTGKVKEAVNHTERPSSISVVNRHFYPSYWDADQLFKLDDDPCEQHNLAGDPEYKAKMKELQGILEEHLEGFDHPFDLAPQPFMQSEQFRSLVDEAMKHKPEDIEWYVRDWGKIIWPPEKGTGF